MKKIWHKSGFGIMEVLVAAVVLGFLIVGLTRLQIGNRESILRIRARDAAMDVAQEVIDSIAAKGLAGIAIAEEPRSCNREDDSTEDLCRERVFSNNIRVDFDVSVDVRPGEDELKARGESHYIDNLGSDASETIEADYKLTKKIDVTVGWQFKDSRQTITMSTVLR